MCWGGCGIDTVEGRRREQYEAYVTVMSPYITLRHELWEQGLQAASQCFQDQDCVGAGPVKV